MLPPALEQALLAVAEDDEEFRKEREQDYTYAASRETANTLRAWSMNIDDNTAQDGHLVVAESSTEDMVPEYCGTITSNWDKGPGNTQIDEGYAIPVRRTEAD